MLVLGPEERGPHDPIDGTPPRVPGSIRRTSTIDAWRPAGAGGELVLEARARDLRTTRDTERVVDGSAFTARLDGRRREVLEISSPEGGPDLSVLLGATVGPGFRSRVDAALPALRTGRTPLYLLLDDLPGASLVSGYALLRAGVDLGSSNPAALEGMADLCAGWARDGVMMSAVRTTGRTPTPVGPPSPSLDRPDDPLAWHDVGPLPPGGTRRRRRMDVVAPDGPDGPFVVDVMFRDSHADDVGLETSLHEYAVRAAVEEAGRVISEIAVTPHVLPWVECPAAVDGAARLVGSPLSGLRAQVRRSFVGVGTCTHLNDTLRGLDDVDELIDRLRGA